MAFDNTLYKLSYNVRSWLTMASAPTEIAGFFGLEAQATQWECQHHHLHHRHTVHIVEIITKTSALNYWGCSGMLENTISFYAWASGWCSHGTSRWVGLTYKVNSFCFKYLRVQHQLWIRSTVLDWTKALIPCAFCHADVDECDTDLNNCHENVQCANTEGSFTCNCNPGYTVMEPSVQVR